MDGEEASSSVAVNGSITNTSFSDDLLIEIFSHLPTKSLFRFKCVSKAWCSLISNDSNQAGPLSCLSGLFYKKRTLDENDYLQRMEYGFACLSTEKACATSQTDTISISLSFLPLYPHFKIVDGCNGLLLCLTGETRGAVFYVSYEIFDSAAGKWENHNAVFHPKGANYLDLISPPTLFNEALHYSCYPFHILRVNLKGGSCDVIELPNKKISTAGTMHGFDGHLYYICCKRDYRARVDKLQIWMLKDWHTEEWIETHEICNKDLGEKILEAGGSCIRNYTRPLAFGPGLDVAFFTDQRNIFSCELETMKVEKIYILGEGDVGTHPSFSFHPALYSPCMNTLEEAGHQLFRASDRR
ncbi:putative F-box protein At5g50220 [Aristolochia californica]|uniref:putative F-box protein At5g50220 n=1 Tax=Aristolochia californica TaxID=171875 RepID=UPI0035DE23E6